MKRALGAIFVCVALLSSCHKPPKPCIEVSTETAVVGAPVTFTSCSKKALSYEWHMEGPAGAPENSLGWSEIQFNHSFTVPGTYNVTLIAYKKFSWLGDSASTTSQIIIN